MGSDIWLLHSWFPRPVLWAGLVRLIVTHDCNAGAARNHVSPSQCSRFASLCVCCTSQRKIASCEGR